MFGTLMCSVQRKEPLTFIENTDHVSALSRSARDKPHMSCELCRKRKIRCNGKPSGCDKCIAMSAECRYPGREGRRKKQPSSEEADSSQQKNSARTERILDTKERGNQGDEQRGVSKDSHESLKDSSKKGTGMSTNGWPLPQTADAGAETFDLELEPDFGQQEMDHWLLASLAEDGSSAAMDTTVFPNSMLFEQLEYPNTCGEMIDDTIGGSLLGDTDSLESQEFDDIDMSMSFSNFPSPGDLTTPMTISPFEDISLLAMAKHSAQTSALYTNNNGDIRRESASRPHSLGRWQSRSTNSVDMLRSASNRLDQRKSNVTSDVTIKDSRKSNVSATKKEQSDPDQSKDGCRCLHLTARLLDELAAKSASRNPVAMDVLLGYFRGALAHCGSTLDCERCTSKSENNMLLAMAGQYMSAMCERIVKCYIDLRRSQEREKSQVERLPSSSGTWDSCGDHASGSSDGGSDIGTETNSSASSIMGSRGGPDDMWFSTYRIESSSERIQVLRCLVTVQLLEFSRLLEKLKARAGNRQGYLIPLMEAERKMKAVKLMLGSDRLS
ncbi:hypothetical protein M501DRAFT_991922 [Patellaria atrata CBS 101060]|uniref:Zn(2)-C6 fungal-type domain-containing protein n=1 Tax=Patellaria atrata CBS 101060 TaxID=1346257 RepID=A0A9P4SC69_9PEZI|nr:hypothetical protein M501DRAFT_991922 [Patellaria atrata CBS 101060]